MLLLSTKNPDSSWSLMPLGGLIQGLGIPERSGESEILSVQAVWLAQWTSAPAIALGMSPG